MKTTKVNFQLENNILIEPDPLWESTLGHGALLFYVRAEYDTIVAENKATIQMMNNGVLESECFCSRGLEAKTRLGSRRRRNIQRRAQDAVLDEQHRQRYENDEDIVMISEVYKGFTIPSHTQAQRQGTRDYECVKDVTSRKHQEPKSTNKDSPCDMTEATDQFLSDIFYLSDNDNDTGSVMTEDLLSTNRDMRTAAILSKTSATVKQTHFGRLFGQNNFSRNAPTSRTRSSLQW
jgi:hypothetical protein